MSGVLRAPGQQNLGGPSCSERIFQHQMIPWTQLVLGTLTQVLADHSDRRPGRVVHCAVGAEWVLRGQLHLGGPGAAAPWPPTLTGSEPLEDRAHISLIHQRISIEPVVGTQSIFAGCLILSSRLEERGAEQGIK